MSVLDLWLPILVSAILVFVASSVIHMLLPIHKGDYRKLPAEEALLADLREHGLAPGHYMFPCPSSMKDMASPEMVARYRAGPVGHMTVRPSGPPTIGKSLGQWFLYSIAIGLFAGYVGAMTLAAGTTAMTVFRVTGSVAILGYGAASIPDSIWKGQSWTTALKFLFDGVVYGLVTGAAFAWLWPSA